MQSPIVIEVVEQHASEAAFLWLLRDQAVHQPHYSLRDLADLDGRIEAHLDGLQIAGNAGWEICAAGLDTEEPGAIFAGSVFALQVLDGQRLEAVIQVARKSRQCWRALVSALGWLRPQQASMWIKSMAASDRAEFQMLAIGGSALQRQNPGPFLTEAIGTDNVHVRARALRAVGELKRHDQVPILLKSLRDSDPATRFWATWSCVLLRNQQAIKHLMTFVDFDSPDEYAQPALHLALRVMDSSSVRELLKNLAQVQASLGHAVAGCGVSGDPAYLPWIIQRMRMPEHARVAGESFGIITGIDLAYEDLDADWPAGFEAGPSDDPSDDHVEMDEDENLPWPDPTKVQGWWDQHKGAFTSGVRYLCGKPITIEHCQHVLRYGFQRQRTAAALELALLQPTEPLFETRAPGFRQQQLLGLKR